MSSTERSPRILPPARDGATTVPGRRSRLDFQAWVVGSIGVALGVTATVVGQSFAGVVVIPPGLGELVSGMGTIVAGLAALVGFTRWQTRHREERQAEAAGQALVAAHEFRSMLIKVVTRASPNHGVPYLQIEAYLAEQRTTISDADLAERFDKARATASAYLPDHAVDALTDLWNIGAEYEDFFIRLAVGCRHNQTLAEPDELALRAWTTKQLMSVQTVYPRVRTMLQGFALLK